MGLHAPSAEEYAANQTSDFSLLPAEDYILEVKEVNIQPDKVDIYSKTTPPRTYDGLEVRFRVVSFANGDSLVDEDGDDVEDVRLFFDWFDPERVGLIPQPAKARKFFASALGQSIEDRIDIEDFEELVGKRLIGTAIIKPNAKGIKKNKLTDYRPIRKRPARKAAADVEVSDAAKAKLAAPKAEAAAAAFEDDDLPF